MRTLGIIGGIGPESTVEYYRAILAAYRERTREGPLRIVERLKERDGIDGIILGGTELALILREDTASGVPLLDTT